jgi:tRNA dimethylallyltransferase
MKKRIIVLAGPTASGKTALAVKLAECLNGEVISADSMQIYRGLKVGTAKPDAEEMRGIEHHLIDFVDPKSEYSAAQYQTDARRVIERLFSEEKTPILAGGTGLYINSVLYDMRFSNSQKNQELRAELEREYDENGGEALLKRLSVYDSAAAAKLHANDKKRIVRAVEAATTGEKPACDEFNSKLFYDNFVMIGLNPDREKLYAKINARVEIMLRRGLIEEIEGLIASGLTFERQSMQSIGYKEFKEYFFNGAPIQEVVETVKQHTRNYAKRQITWFKRYPAINWIDSYQEAAFKEIENILKVEN